MQELPTISIRGRLVTVQAGPDTTVHTCGSHEDAIDLAAQLEDEARAMRAHEESMLAANIEAGHDVVVPADWVATEPPAPPAEPEPATPVAAGPVIMPAPSDSGADNGTILNTVVTVAEPGIVPAASDTEPPPPPPVVITVKRYEPSTQRLMITIQAAEPVKLHRVAGDRTADTELTAGEHDRWFKAAPGVAWEFRLDGATGPVVASGVIPQT